jgi:hypothetical protein
MNLAVLGGLVVSVLAIVPKVSGFKPGRRQWIFKGDKNLQHVFVRKVGAMLQDFTTC